MNHNDLTKQLYGVNYPRDYEFREKALFSFISSLEKQMRGNRVDHLRNYVKEILQAVANQGADLALLSAEEDFSLLRKMVSEIIQGEKTENATHPLYEQIKALMEQLPEMPEDSFKRSYGNALAAIYVCGPMFQKRLDEYEVMYRNSVSAKDINNLREKLLTMIGKDNLELLDLLIKQLFMITPMGDIYLGAMANELAQELLIQEKETGKLVIEYVIENIAAVTEE